MNNIDKELVGFLLADGCLTIIRQNLTRKYKDKIYHSVSYVPKVNVTQRVDGIEILNTFQKRFGGYISKNASIQKISNSKPVKYWVVSNYKVCGEIARLIMNSVIPSPKRKTAKILYEYCKWRLPMKSRKLVNKETAKAEQFYNLIHEANSFKE